MRLGRRRLSLGAALAFAVAQPLVAQDLTLPLDAAREVAIDAVLAGDDELARSLAAGLLSADPDDRVALLVLATVEPGLGRPAEGRRAGARAWWLSDTGPQRYEAARLTARAAAAEGNLWLSGIWLRLALASAPTHAEEEATLADAAALRPLQRWQTELSFRLSPSGNVNGGAASPDFIVEDVLFPDFSLSADSLPLSGWVGTGSLRAAYRLRESPVARTRLSFGIGGSFVLLSDDAEAKLEADPSVERRGISAEDFSDAFAEIGLEHDQAVGPGVLTLSGDVGRRWPGGEWDYNYAGLSTGYSLWVGEAAILQFQGSHEWRDQPDMADLERVWSASLGLLWTSRIGDTQIRLSYGETDSEEPNSRDESRSVTVSHDFLRPLGPAYVSLSAGYQVTDFPDYGFFFFAVPRRDETVSASLAAAFPDYAWAGFEPVVRLEGARTDSNYSRFETRSLGIGFEVRSSF